MRYAQLVMGPAGSGKSHYCSTMSRHASVSQRRNIHVVNLDPAAEQFDYEPLVDIRDCIEVTDVMEDEDMHLGPNGGLIFCLEFLLENMNFLSDALDVDQVEDDYILFDCPGQIELYTHLNVMQRLVSTLQAWDFRMVGVFLLDSQYMTDGGKFISGSMAALAAMANLEIPHVNVLSKMDLLSPTSKKHLDSYLIPDTRRLCDGIDEVQSGSRHRLKVDKLSSRSTRYANLTRSVASVLDQYSLVSFIPMDISDEDMLTDVLLTIDRAIQYGEDADVDTRDKPFEVADE